MHRLLLLTTTALLLLLCAPPCSAKKTRRDAWSKAVRAGDTGKVRALLDDGVATAAVANSVLTNLTTVVGNASMTALVYTIVNEDPETFDELLLHPQVDVAATDDDGRTALHAAIEAVTDTRYLARLLDHPDLDGINDRRPVHHCLETGRLNAARVLIGHTEVDLEAVDEDGLDAEALAEDNGEDDIAALVRDERVRRRALLPGGARTTVPKSKWDFTAMATAMGKRDAATLAKVLSDTAPDIVNSRIGLVLGTAAPEGDGDGDDGDEDNEEEATEEKRQVPALVLSVSNQAWDMFALLLALPGIDAGAVDEVGTAALHVAAGVPDARYLRALLARGDVDPNGTQEASGATALHFAVQAGYYEHVHVLLADARVDATLAADSGATAAEVAADTNRNDLRKLLAHGRDATPFGSGADARAEPRSALAQALEATDADAVAAALAAAGGDGAAVLANTRVLVTDEALIPGLEAAEDEEAAAAQERVHLPPLMYAVLAESWEAFDALLAVDGVDAGLVDDSDMTALHYAAALEDTRYLEALLARAGADVDPNAKDANGFTALHQAANYGRTHVAEALCLVEGLDIDAESNRGWSSFHSADAGGHEDTAAVIKKHADAAREAAGRAPVTEGQWIQVDVDGNCLNCEELGVDFEKVKDL